MRKRLIGVAAAGVLAIPQSAGALGPGSLDRTFGVNGLVVTSIGTASPTSLSAEPRAVVAAPDGGLTVGGSANDEAGRRAFALARYTASGRLDQTFGTNGTIVLQLGEGPDPSSSVSSLALQPDGGVVAVGGASQPDRAGALAAARFDEAGRVMWSVVHQIGRPYVTRLPNGTTYTSLSSSGAVVLRQPGGKLVVGGSASMETSFCREMAVARLHSTDGSLDPSFAGGGFVVEPASGGGTGCPGDGIATALAPSPSGSIVVGGGVPRKLGVGGISHIPIFRAYTPTGARDTTFATGPTGLGDIRYLALGPNGSLLAMGSMNTTVATEHPAFARYTSAGALDDTFAPPTGFTAAPEVERIGAWPAGFAVQPDGRLVGAMYVQVGSEPTSSRVVRMLPDGSHDESFGIRGIAAIAFGRSAMTLQPDGSIVVAGYPTGRDFDGREFALTRLLGGTATGRIAINASAPVRRRLARITLTCNHRGASACNGTLTITSRAGRRSARRVTFGRARFSLAAGARSTALVRLNRSGLRRIRRAHRRLVVSVRATNGKARATQRRVTLFAARQSPT